MQEYEERLKGYNLAFKVKLIDGKYFDESDMEYLGKHDISEYLVGYTLNDQGQYVDANGVFSGVTKEDVDSGVVTLKISDPIYDAIHVRPLFGMWIDLMDWAHASPLYAELSQDAKDYIAWFDEI